MADEVPGEHWASLSGRPGFLIRRLHQIHLALFAEECGRYGVTPVQFSLLSVVAVRPGLDQSALALEVGVDRATTANVLARLEGNGFLSRSRSAEDSRVKLIHLTQAGRRVLARMDAGARRAHDRTLTGLSPGDRDRFMELLARLVDIGNDHGRAPMRLADEG
jgi:DNA-binding MarR family transcriptional regulator